MLGRPMPSYHWRRHVYSRGTSHDFRNPSRIRGRSMGYLSIAAAMGIALGPGIGGYLTTYLSWRSIFFVNVPICIFAIILGQRIVPDIPGSRPGEKIDMRNVKVPSVMMRRRPLHYAERRLYELFYIDPL